MGGSIWMYGLTGVPRPATDPARLEARAAMYDALSNLSEHTRSSVDEAVQMVLDDNEGYALDNFRRTMRYPESSMGRLEELRTKATDTADAFRDAAAELREGVRLMDLETKLGEAKIIVALTGFPRRPWTIRRIVRETTDALLLIEQNTVGKIEFALSLELPFAYDQGHRYTSDEHRPITLDEETLQRWSTLSQEEREEVLRQRVEDWAEEHGYDPPPEVVIEQPERKDAAGTYYPDEDKIRISPKAAASERAFPVLEHELGHAEQWRLFAQYDDLSESDLEAIREGRARDPFREYGYTVDEVEYMRESTQYYNPDNPTYRQHPIEVDAQEEAAEGTMNYDDETLNQYMDEAEG